MKIRYFYRFYKKVDSISRANALKKLPYSHLWIKNYWYLTKEVFLWQKTMTGFIEQFGDDSTGKNITYPTDNKLHRKIIKKCIAIADKKGHRRKGIGKLLLTPLIASAKEMQLHSLIAGIDANNLPSIKLHEQSGFTQIGHFKEVGFKFGACSSH